MRLAGYINQDETAILCGVWEFVGQEPNNSVYLAPLTNIQRQELIVRLSRLTLL